MLAFGQMAALLKHFYQRQVPNHCKYLQTTNNLSVFYHNVDCLRSKIYDFALKIVSMPYDVIILTATWLNEDFLIPVIFDCNMYNVCRKDRCTKTTGLKRGEGVLIVIRCNISVNSHALPVNSAMVTDKVIVKLKLHKYIYTLARTPEIGQGLGHILSCAACKAEQT